MDIILTVIGILALGALLIAAWVFASAAKRNVNGEHVHDNIDAQRSTPASGTAASPDQSAEKAMGQQWRLRSSDDRRQRPPPNVFPIVVNGKRIEKDRRRNPDRRRAA